MLRPRNIQSVRAQLSGGEPLRRRRRWPRPQRRPRRPIINEIILPQLDSTRPDSIRLDSAGQTQAGGRPAAQLDSICTRSAPRPPADFGRRRTGSNSTSDERESSSVLLVWSARLIAIECVQVACGAASGHSWRRRRRRRRAIRCGHDEANGSKSARARGARA